jgi:serine/threonine-protein phosphatase 6 regulatory subunit 3
MALLNRSPEYDGLYDSDGRLQGGLSALEELAQVISIASTNDHGQEPMDDQEDEPTSVKELPIHDQSLSLDSDEDMIADDEPSSSDDEAMEEIAMYDDHRALPSASLPSPPSSSPMGLIPSPPHSRSPTSSRKRSSDSLKSTATARSRSMKPCSRKGITTDTLNDFVPLGERFKQRFLELDVLSTLLVSAICVVAFIQVLTVI